MVMTKNIFNISGYRFFSIADAPSYREAMLKKCEELELMGSILLTPEGMNVMLAASKENIESFKLYLTQELGFPEIDYRESWSEDVPYNRMLIKNKKKIIAGPEYRFDADNGIPLTPQEFKQWLDEDRDIQIIDVRNDYENRLGAFEKSEHFDMYNFNELPEVAQNYFDKYDKSKPIVSICTGGIKTEKASMVLKDFGFKDVYFLQGGIIKYFEEVGGDHYKGGCFVFDKRVCVDSELKEVEVDMCFACRAPLTAEDKKSPLFVENEFCPYCEQRKGQEKVALQKRLALAKKQEASADSSSTFTDQGTDQGVENSISSLNAE